MTHRVRGTEPGRPSVELRVAAAGASAVSAIFSPETPARSATVTVTASPSRATLLPA